MTRADFERELKRELERRAEMDSLRATIARLEAAAARPPADPIDTFVRMSQAINERAAGPSPADSIEKIIGAVGKVQELAAKSAPAAAGGEVTIVEKSGFPWDKLIDAGPQVLRELRETFPAVRQWNPFSATPRKKVENTTDKARKTQNEPRDDGAESEHPATTRPANRGMAGETDSARSGASAADASTGGASAAPGRGLRVTPDDESAPASWAGAEDLPEYAIAHLRRVTPLLTIGAGADDADPESYASVLWDAMAAAGIDLAGVIDSRGEAYVIGAMIRAEPSLDTDSAMGFLQGVCAAALTLAESAGAKTGDSPTGIEPADMDDDKDIE